MRHAKVDRCEGGHLPADMYERRAWHWRFHRCTTCGLLVLPFVVRHADPSHWAYAVRRIARDVRYRIKER